MLTVLLAGCGQLTSGPSLTESGSTDCPCDRIELPGSPVTTEADLAILLSRAVIATFPELTDVDLVVSPVDALQFFRSSIDLVSLDPLDDTTRVYRVEYDPVVLSDPPEPAALAAVLVHELGHIADYTAMTGTAYLDFGLWYGSSTGTDELAAYERATDEQALARGCAPGLAAMRDWVYTHCSGEVLAEKQRDYYTPEEIEAWTGEYGACTIR